MFKITIISRLLFKKTLSIITIFEKVSCANLLVGYYLYNKNSRISIYFSNFLLLYKSEEVTLILTILKRRFYVFWYIVKLKVTRIVIKNIFLYYFLEKIPRLFDHFYRMSIYIRYVYYFLDLIELNLNIWFVRVLKYLSL